MAHDHDDDHGSPLTETQLRVRALESLLIEKGLVDPQAGLLADATAAIAELGFTGRQGDASQFGNRFGFGPAHDRRAMLLNRPLADTQLKCNVLAGVAVQDHLHDLALAGSQVTDMVNGGLAKRLEALGIRLVGQGVCQAGQ